MTASPRLVIFDMDGTLTQPCLEFARIREEIGVDEPILEAMAKMLPAARSRAVAILERHEALAAEHSELQPGAAETVAAIRASGIPAVLMTRNSRRSVEALIARHDLTFDLVRTREDGEVKPSPAPILSICRRFETEPSRTWTIGDFHYDILCGAAAGAVTVLLLDPTAARPVWAKEADYVIHALRELPPLLGIEDAPLGRPM